MAVLITGGAGYIGSHMVHLLKQELKDESIIVYDNLSTGFRETIDPSINFFLGDVRDQKLCQRILKDHQIDSVIHFAALSVVPDSVSEPLRYYEHNVVGTLNLLQACQAAGVKNFIFSSSASVYGEQKSNPVNEGVFLSPASTYGQTKLMGEVITEDICSRHGMHFACLRYFNVAGARPDLNLGQKTARATHLIKVTSEVFCEKRSALSVYGNNFRTKDGTGVRDYIHVWDLVDLHWLTLQKLRKGSTQLVFNCGYGHGSSVLDVIRSMEKVTGKTCKYSVQEARPGDVGEVYADTRRLQQIFPDWQPQFASLEKICETAYIWETRLAK